MSFSFYLDGTQYDNPSQDRTLTTSLKRNSNLNGILVTNDSSFVFTGESYKYLYNKYFDNLCNEVSVEIYENCTPSRLVYKGVIKISDVTINYRECSITTDIKDDNFYSYINNNKRVKVQLDIESKSKSGLTIPALDVYTAKFFNPADGVYGGYNTSGWLVFDVMQYILDYITDGRIELRSDLLSGAGDEYQLFLTQGQAMKPPGYAAPEEVKLSFDDIYLAMQQIYNVAFRIENPDTVGGRYIMRIEKSDYFYQTNGTLVIEDVSDLEISTDDEDIYGTIRVGSQAHARVTDNLPSQVESTLYGWDEDQFHLTGQCNLDKELNLKVNFQTASNVIEDVYPNISNDFDNDLFLVEVEIWSVGLKQLDTIRHSFYGATTPPYYYNIGISNSNNLIRRSGYLHQSIQTALEGGADQFKSRRLQTQYASNQAGICVYTLSPPPGSPNCWNTFDPVAYNDVTSPGYYNNGGNYDNTTYKYTCPANGSYTFEHTVFYKTFGIQQAIPAIGQVPSSIKIRVGIKNLTNGTFTQQQPPTFFQNSNGSITSSFSLQCDAGDEIQAYIELQFVRGNVFVPTFGIDFYDGSYFTCTSTPSSEGGVLNINTSIFKAYLMKFSYSIEGSTFDDILADPTQLINITTFDNKIFRGWIDELEYNNFTKQAEITLRTNAAIQDAESTAIQ